MSNLNFFNLNYYCNNRADFKNIIIIQNKLKVCTQVFLLIFPIFDRFAYFVRLSTSIVLYLNRLSFRIDWITELPYEIAIFNSIFFWKKYFRDLLKIFVIDLKEKLYYNYLKMIILYPGLCSIFLVVTLTLFCNGGGEVHADSINDWYLWLFDNRNYVNKKFAEAEAEAHAVFNWEILEDASRAEAEAKGPVTDFDRMYEYVLMCKTKHISPTIPEMLDYVYKNLPIDSYTDAFVLTQFEKKEANQNWPEIRKSLGKDLERSLSALDLVSITDGVKTLIACVEHNVINTIIKHATEFEIHAGYAGIFPEINLEVVTKQLEFNISHAAGSFFLPTSKIIIASFTSNDIFDHALKSILDKNFSAFISLGKDKQQRIIEELAKESIRLSFRYVNLLEVEYRERLMLGIERYLQILLWHNAKRK
jgi:hypothetical protein